MGLTNLTFFLFVIISLTFYYLLPRKYSYIGLLLSNIIFLFYNNFSIEKLVFVLVIFLTSFLSSILMVHFEKKKKIALVVSIFIILFELIYLKYTNLFLTTSNIIFKTNFSLIKTSAPIGLSYYSLMMISFIVSSYYGEIEEKNPLKIGTFMIYFPTLTSGPLIKYNNLKEKLDTRVKFDINNIFNGFVRSLWGLFKVLVISTRLNLFVSHVYANLDALNPIIILLAIFLYTFELYTNFSGSIDIIMGVSKMFGITLPENFKNPFASTTITEFWRVWHITLGDFLRDYIFYPLLKSKAMQNLTKKCKSLFGKKGKKIPVFISMFILWLIIGIWHGGEYKYILASGILQFIFIFIEDLFSSVNKKRSTIARLICIIRTFTLFSLSMVFFRATNIQEGIDILKHLFIFNGDLTINFITIFDLIVILVSLIILLIVDNKMYKVKEIINKSKELRLSIICTLILIVLLFGNYGLNFVASDFIYGKF